MNLHPFKYITATVLLASPLQAGTAPISAPETHSGDWCSWLQNKPGTFYKNADNPYIQEIQLGGRLHWQYGYVDGETLGQKFNYDTEEIRRLRLGLKVKFLNYFTLSSSFDLEDDQAPTGRESDHDVQYADIYSATLAFDAHKAFDVSSLDALKISIGKHKISGSGEYAITSRHIKTIERSAISNYVTPGSSTGLQISGKKGQWDFSTGIFSADKEPEFSEFDSSNDFFYTLHLGYALANPSYFEKSRVDLRVIVNGDETANASSNANSPGVYNRKWSASLSSTHQKGRFNLLTDVIYGDNGAESTAAREGDFYALVFLPSYYLIENKLEAVFRYQYAHASSDQGIQLNSRYARRAGGVRGLAALSRGYGDEHHSVYLGLNYYLCGQNAKVMVGAEYDDLDQGSQDIYEGISAWAGFRMYF